ncbi:zinc finger BED domain-containing protein RICESLEEPER 3-like [Arachis duranensis]|uniref:Zinc finger BED domain-containing protein RICESLEEPER 3-like n=1 Tax=Arachis duranensis TaxID=130453 RepID=A0A6P4BM21_ARADU|nr:zinc finger BED domain-containing protein RICESLEEPER 3-like [Arachis duranensis]
MSLTAHFIDEEWMLQKRIINFCQIENHKGDTVGREIEKCLREWGIEKVFTITVDNTTSNDGAITYLQRKLGARGGLVCGGKYMHVRCCAHVLNLVVNEGIKEQHTSIESIRNAVRWFGEDSGGKKKIGPPTPLDWQHARLFMDFLRVFYEITLTFSSSLHVTSNICFHEIASVASQLTSWSHNQSDLLGSMACAMKHKYDKYWGPVDKFNPLLLVAVVLDPRYKLDYLCWCLEDVYDKEVSTSMTGVVKLTLDTLHKFYEKEVIDDKGRDDGGDSSSIVLDDNIKISAGAKGVSENRVNMILSLIARDILGIPVSTVASESCFSTGGRVLDVFRSSLSPLMAEALICTQSWLCPSKQNVGDQEFDQFDNSQKIVEGVVSMSSRRNIVEISTKVPPGMADWLDSIVLMCVTIVDPEYCEKFRRFHRIWENREDEKIYELLLCDPEERTDILWNFNMAPSQLHPNSRAFMKIFRLWCQELGV